MENFTNFKWAKFTTYTAMKSKYKNFVQSHFSVEFQIANIVWTTNPPLSKNHIIYIMKNTIYTTCAQYFVCIVKYWMKMILPNLSLFVQFAIILNLQYCTNITRFALNSNWISYIEIMHSAQKI